jgi:Cys-tRNA(Pro)/Cys-tRNA(Cys) deacylase
MTPCVKLLKKHQKLYTMHQYKHESSWSSYADEAAAKLGVEQGRVFKTLVVQTDKQVLAVGVVPVSSKLSLKAMAKALDAKKVSMADAKDVQIATGYVLGGVSPLGQKKRLRTVIDESARDYETVFVSAGKRGLEVELSPYDLQELSSAVFESIQDN